MSEEYSVGYSEGYQAGWNEAMDAAPPAAQPAVPDAIHHTDTSETLEYIQGWNDCRSLMLKSYTLK